MQPGNDVGVCVSAVIVELAARQVHCRWLAGALSSSQGRLVNVLLTNHALIAFRNSTSFLALSSVEIHIPAKEARWPLESRQTRDSDVTEAVTARCRATFCIEILAGDVTAR